MTVSIATQWREREAGSPHVSIAVFAGSDPDHRALVGTLIARRNEAAEIEARLQDPGDMAADLIATAVREGVGR